jgi:peptide deformylase
MAQSAAYVLRYLGDPVLAQMCTPIDLAAPGALAEVRAVAEGLRRVASEQRRAVAIAAPQVGAPVQVILTPVKGLKTIMVNPVLTRKARSTSADLEGCLSIPEFWLHVPRRRWVAVEFTPEDLSERVTLRLVDFEARALQHELAHLDGQCIVGLAGVSRQQRRHAERCVAKAREQAARRR